MKKISLISILVLSVTNLLAQWPINYDVNGIKWNNSSTFKIDMSSGANYSYGLGVTAGSIKTPALDGTNYGFTWGEDGKQPFTALDTKGNLQTKGYLYSENYVKTGRLGTFGTYNSSQVQGIWSISEAYKIRTDINTFGTQYGMGYAYSTLSGAPFANEHQIVFTNNGTVNAAIGLTGKAYFNGTVGIGTKTPNSNFKLDVVGAVKIGDANYNYLFISSDVNGTGLYNMAAGSSTFRSMSLGAKSLTVYNALLNNTTLFNIAENGDVGVSGNIFVPGNKYISFGDQNSTMGYLRITNVTNCFNTYMHYKNNLFFTPWGNPRGIGFQSDGSVIIGVYEKYDAGLVPTDGHKLMVNGGILCERLKVIGDVPNSDHVFEKEYDLKSLTEVDAFIKLNKHLPEVPSAKCFKEDGYNVGEMDDILLRKIEELTLYIIELNKEMAQLKAQIKKN